MGIPYLDDLIGGYSQILDDLGVTAKRRKKVKFVGATVADDGTDTTLVTLSGSGITLAGDLGNTAANPQVRGLYGVPLDAGFATPTDQDALHYDSGTNSWKVGKLPIASITAGTVGQVLTTSGGAAAWTTIGGDVSGTVGAISVDKIKGATVPSSPLLADVGKLLGVSGAGALAYALATDANVDPSAAIAGSKINPDFGAQDIVTTGNATAASVTARARGADADGGYFLGLKDRAGAIVHESDYVAGMIAEAWDGSSWVLPTGSLFQVTPGSTPAAGTIGIDWLIVTGSSGLGTERLRVDSAGNLTGSNLASAVFASTTKNYAAPALPTHYGTGSTAGGAGSPVGVLGIALTDNKLQRVETLLIGVDTLNHKFVIHQAELLIKMVAGTGTILDTATAKGKTSGTSPRVDELGDLSDGGTGHDVTYAIGSGSLEATVPYSTSTSLDWYAWGWLIEGTGV